jgi:hypothetical protein
MRQTKIKKQPNELNGKKKTGVRTDGRGTQREKY